MPGIEDNRSKVVVVTCHCALNQNAKLEGIAGWKGVIPEIVHLLVESGAGILQMPCPEMLYEGVGRFDKSYEQYNCTAFQKICRRIATDTLDQIQNYLQWGYKVPVILAIDGSPSCGFNLTQSAPEWRGLVAGQPWQKVRYISHPGVLFEQIKEEMDRRGLSIPILGIPEIPELGSLDATLSTLRSVLSVKS